MYNKPVNSWKPNSWLQNVEGVKPLVPTREELEHFKNTNTIFKEYVFEEMKNGYNVTKYQKDGKYIVLVLYSFGEIFSLVTRKELDSLEECEKLYHYVLSCDNFVCFTDD